MPADGHSPSAPDQFGSVTGVTCPTVRYHQAIIARTAATVSIFNGFDPTHK
jgi:hypothetical protein